MEYTLKYFLADDSIEVSEVQQPNSGRDSFPKLLSRCKLPKNPPSICSAKIGIDVADNIDYYSHSDLRIGSYISVYGRYFLITKADTYTKQFYIDVHGLTTDDLKPILQKRHSVELFRT